MRRAGSGRGHGIVQYLVCRVVRRFVIRIRPDIRQSPVPAGYPASISGSGSGPAEEKFAGFLPGNDFLSKIKIQISLK